MSRFLVLFETTHSVIKAERLCLAAGIACKVIAVPRQISSECGISLELEEGQMATVKQLLGENSVKFETYRME